MPGNEFSFVSRLSFLWAISFPSGGSKIFLGRKKEMGLVAMRFVVRKMHAVYDGIS